MNIPFYRYVRYDDDGHYIYQCLQCGEKIDVGHWQFNPRFCAWCGTEYKGFILPKKIEYVSIPSTQETVYIIEKGVKWGKREVTGWDETWRKTADAKVALQFLQEARTEVAEDNKKAGGYVQWVVKVVRKKEQKNYGSLKIDVDKYKKRAGKKFGRTDGVLHSERLKESAQLKWQKQNVSH